MIGAREEQSLFRQVFLYKPLRLLYVFAADKLRRIVVVGAVGVKKLHHRQAFFLPERKVVLAVHHRRVHDAGALGGGNEVRREHDMLFAFVRFDRVDAVERLVVRADKLAAEQLARDPCRMPVPSGRVRARGTRRFAPQARTEYRARPRARRCPEASTESSSTRAGRYFRKAELLRILQLKLHRHRFFGHVLVGVVGGYFGLGERRLAVRAVHQDLPTLVQKLLVCISFKAHQTVSMYELSIVLYEFLKSTQRPTRSTYCSQSCTY